HHPALHSFPTRRSSDLEILQVILGDEQPIDHRPADDLPPEVEKATEEVGDLAETIDDVLSYIMFPGPAKEFLEWRRGGLGPERRSEEHTSELQSLTNLV